MRVYELAKKLGMESRQLIPELVRMGIEVTSHSNALDEATAQRVLQAFQEDGRIDRRQEPLVSRKEKGSLYKKRTGQTEGGSRAKAAVEEAAPKPQRKRILIKRKKLEAEETAVPQSQIESVTAQAEAADSQAQAFVVPQEPKEAEPDTSVVPESIGSVESAEHLTASEVAAEELVTDSIGQEEVLQGPLPVSPETREEKIEAKEPPRKKELGSLVVDDLVEEKVKKPKKAGRLRDEDLFAARYEDAARWQDLRPLPTLRREERIRHHQPTAVTEITKPRKKGIKLEPGITVKAFAELLGQRPADIVKKLMDMGVLLTLNQPMNLDAASLIAADYGVTVEVVAEKAGEALLEEMQQEQKAGHLVPRAPVVTVMGHVDHGKTSLLDAIRQTQVTSREAGGITQHIGAYSVAVGDKRITFLDTPGHEAFTAMRARGAQVTDIVVLVVAADDGVMPQTVEAIHHAQAANVPIIVAINKIDKPGANPDRVKQGLAEHGLIPEAWGGQTIYVEVSAKQKLGIEQLLEMILLQAEVMELRADAAGPGKGVVLEAKLDRGRGPVATVLVQAGTIKVGDVFVVGTTSGRVRALISDSGARLKEAGPSTPVEVVGLLAVPTAGDQFLVVKDERVAREVAADRLQRQRAAELKSVTPERTLEELFAQGAASEVKELPLLIKSDVHGSIEALCEAVRKLSTDRVKLRVLHSGVGGISESDVLLAAASRAMIIGFHVRPEPKAAALAEREGVEIRLYTVIYNVIEDLKKAAEGLLAPTIKERVLGRAEVRQLFSVPRVGTVAGCYVVDGQISRACAGVRVIRDHVSVYEGKLGSLRRFKDDVREVQQGYECGISIENFNDLKVGDIIEAYVYDEEAAKL